MAKLFIVATPIGNLKDITLRAIEVLKSADFILAEDTRVARRLLAHLGIHKKPLVAFREHSPPKVLEKIFGLLQSGSDLALVTDAGTPGISDPVQRLIKFLTAQPLRYLTIQPVPGPSALSAMLSVSDIDLDQFCFWGFPPHKKGREKFFKLVAAGDRPVILFESPYRIIKTLKALKEVCGDRYVNIGRELTKIYEEVFRGSISEAQNHFLGEKLRGEFVIVLDSK